MELSSYTTPYWEYLQGTGLSLSEESQGWVAEQLAQTNWDDPQSPMDCNNSAVMALIEAERTGDLTLRAMYLETAIALLEQCAETNTLCAIHLMVVNSLIGETTLASQQAFSMFVSLLQSVHSSTVPAAIPGLIYLPTDWRSPLDTHYSTLGEILETAVGDRPLILLLGEILCQSQWVFYSSTGLRFLHLAHQLFPNDAALTLKLGIANLLNKQWEGLWNLHCAQQLQPDHPIFLHALYLAYRDLNEPAQADYWESKARTVYESHPELANDLAWCWIAQSATAVISYVPFQEKILAVQPSFQSIVTSVLLAEGRWFEREMEFWHDHIQPGMTVIDVGANVGVYTIAAAQQVGKTGRVLAVEPFSGCVQCLQETCRVNALDWVTVCQGAASDRDGTVRLGLYSASELNQIIPGDTAIDPDAADSETVPCFTLDTLVEHEQLIRVDLLKIDAEGHEMQVLLGSDRLLRDFAPIILYENIAGSQDSNLPVAEFLMANGYRLFRYQPYIKQLIPIGAGAELHGSLNIIALPDAMSSEGQTTQECSRETVAEQSQDIEALNLLATFQLAEGQIQEAIASLRQVIELQPDSPEPHNNLGMVWLELGQIDAAISSFQAALQLQPHNTEFLNELLLQLTQIEQFDTAILLAIRALQINPIWDQGYLYIGYALQQKNTDPEAAKACATGLLPGRVIQHYCPEVVNPHLSRSNTSQSVIYTAIRAGETIALTPPKTLAANPHPAFFNHQIQVLPAFIATLAPGRIWSDSYTRAVLTVAPTARSGTTESQLVEDASTGNGDLIASSNTLPPPVGFSGRLACLTIRDSHNYFHWMYDLLPKLEVLEIAGLNPNEIDAFVVNHCRYPFQRELLNLMGILDEKILDPPIFHGIADTLIVPVASPAFATGRISQQTCQFLRRKLLGSRLENLTSRNTIQATRFYISRKSANYRKVVNEEDVIASLQPFGFECIALETLSVRAQIALFASAEVVVAPHGAGLSNVIFAQPGTKLVEIFLPDEVMDYYWAISQHVGIDYYALIAESGKPIVQNIQGKGFVSKSVPVSDLIVPIQELLKTLRVAGIY